jgi:acetyl esterase/lipase
MTPLFYLLMATVLIGLILFFSWEWLLLQYIRRLAEPKPVAIPEDISVISHIPYTETEHGPLHLDLYRPSRLPKEPLPIVISLFGGGWFVGNKNQPVSKPMSAHLLARSGYAVAVINYRLSDTANHPAAINDANAAINWLRRNAHDHHLDAEHIAAWGCSAGGHLAAMLATPYTSDDAGNNISAAINFFGISDLQSHVNSSKRTHLASARWMVERYLGHPTHQSPARLADASPINHVTSNSAPMLIVHGDQDSVVAPQQSELLLKTYQQHNAPCELQVIPEAGHGTGAYFGSDEMFNTIVKFLDQHLKPSRS